MLKLSKWFASRLHTVSVQLLSVCLLSGTLFAPVSVLALPDVVPPKIAVLPFHHVTDNTSEDWISVGLHESLTTDISSISALEPKTFHFVSALVAQECPGLKLHCVAKIKLDRWQAIARKGRLNGFIWAEYSKGKSGYDIALRIYTGTDFKLQQEIRFKQPLSKLLAASSKQLLKLLENHGLTAKDAEKKRVLSIKTRSVAAWESYSKGYWLEHQGTVGIALPTGPITTDEIEALKADTFGYTGEKLTVNFTDIKLSTLLDLISDFTGLLIELSEELPAEIQSSSIAISMKNKPWDQVLDLVLQSKGLSVAAGTQSGMGIMVVLDKDRFAREKNNLEARQRYSELGPRYRQYRQWGARTKFAKQQIAMFEQAVKKDPGYAEARARLDIVKFAYDIHDLDKTKASLDMTESSYKSARSNLNFISKTQHDKTRNTPEIDKAKLEKAIYKAKKNLEIEKAEFDKAKRGHDKTKDRHEKVLAIKPWLIDANVYFAFHSGQSKYLSQATEINPSASYLEKMLAVLYLKKKKDYPQALKTIQKYLVRNPNDYEAKQLLCEILRESKKPSESLECAIEVLANGGPYRQDAARTLGAIGLEKSVALLSKALTDADSRLRRAAARALGEIGLPASVEPLVTATKDRDPLVRSDATYALKGQKSKRSVSAVINSLEDPYAVVRLQAVRALRSMDSPKVVPALLRSTLSDEEEHVRRDAKSILFHNVSDKQLSENIPALLKLLNSPKEGGRLLAVKLLPRVVTVESLDEITPVIPRLKDLLEDPSEEIRYRSQRMLEKLTTLLGKSDSPQAVTKGL